MSSNLIDDLEYLQSPDRTEVQRWAWLAGRLDQLTRNADTDLLRIDNHERQLDKIEKRCAGRAWQGRITWFALTAALGSWVERVVTWGGK